MFEPFVIEVVVEAKFPLEQEKLFSALTQMASEDANFGVAVNHDTGQAILRGMSERHLDMKVFIIQRIYKLEIQVKSIQAAYVETLTTRVEVDQTFRKQTDGVRQFARVKIIFEPNPIGTGSSFQAAVHGTFPEKYISSIEGGFDSATRSGVLAGCPVVDVRATLVDAAFDETESSELVFETCARAVSRRAFTDGRSILLEPFMDIHVTLPEAYERSITGDIQARRGRVVVKTMRGDKLILEAKAPFANLFGYTNVLRSLSQGHATFVRHALQPPCSGPAAVRRRTLFSRSRDAGMRQAS